ncbi:LCP family protein [Clostridiaceae bacterium M8S5]|nr:LCP family protein [Clostridiaceae bacterium M8S5]
MKFFVRIFIIALICFALAIGAGILAYMRMYEPLPEPTQGGNIKQPIDKEKDNEQERTPLQTAMNESNRVNVILMGLEGTRTDTMIFASFDPDKKKLNLLSIPRDTYYHEDGIFKDKGSNKINAVYGRSGKRGVIDAVSNVLGGVPIEFYISVGYNGVEEIVDAIGGVEVVVPRNLDYDDTGEGRNLHIKIKKGKQVLNGKNSVEFLRWRKNNDGTGYPDGDLGRIKTQQKFIKLAIEKALGLKLPSVVNTATKYIKTNIPLQKMLLYANSAIEIDTEKDITMNTLPGVAKKDDYYRRDVKEIKEYVMNMYGVTERN